MTTEDACKLLFCVFLLGVLAGIAAACLWG